MMKYIKRMSLRSRIVLLALFLTISVVEIFSVLYYQKLARDLEQNLTDYANSLSIQVGQYFNERLNIFVKQVYTLTKCDRFQQTFLEYLSSDSPYQYSLSLSDFNSLISEVKIPDSFFGSAYLYTPKRTFYDLTNISHSDSDFIASDLYAEYLEMGASIIYYGHQMPDAVYNTDRNVIPIVLQARINGYLGEIFLVVNINSSVIENYLAKSTIPGVDVLIIDKNNRIVASGNPARTETYMEIISPRNETIRPESKDYIISSAKIDINNWKVITFSDKSVMNESLRNSQAFLFLLHIIAILITLLCSLYFSGLIVKPLQDLQKCMYRFTEGDYSLQYEYNYDNEVGRLAAGFNTMVHRIGELVGELHSSIEQLQVEKENVHQEQTLKRTAELNALQAQIDPHFLYNTLNSIVWLAAEEETDKISKLAASLSAFYKYRIRGQGTFVSIRDEIEEISNYIDIQKLRYGNSIECRFELDESLIDRLTIKMIVQPLVENAIFHGLCCKDGATGIIIRIVLADKNDPDGDFFIEVIDNGAGIPPQILETINQHLAECAAPPIDGYGIYNVNERIRLFFGKPYGLSYESRINEGTCARLKLPQIKDKEKNGLKCTIY
jgi:two-component system sensor histidine kinase YesM